MQSSVTTEQASGDENGFEELIAAYVAEYPDGDVALLRKAYELARDAHHGQFRKSGAAYITHPVAVTRILVEYGLDSSTLAASLLHDTVEDTSVTLELLVGAFGQEIAYLVDGVTKLDRISYSSREQAQAATIRKMVVAMAQDVRVLLIKLADRLHNMRTVSHLRPEKQIQVARETLDVYAPLAHRLGVQEIKHELEDRCFEVLYPGPHAELDQRLAVKAPERQAFIDQMISTVSGMVAEAGISARVSGRPKHHYSIYRKMVDQSRPFDDIHDLIGLRVVTQTVQECYAVLGLVHARWVPVSGRFKDFIAMPKFNLYQSLHTTVIGPDGKPLEIQIRTAEMHQVAESGIAAHWRYKEGADAANLEWMSQIRAMEGTMDPEEFLDDLKLDLYQDEVFVMTPAGDVKTLPRDATAVDFAYAVHTEVGHHCVGARINGRLLPLSTRLQSGDIVEVLTSNSRGSGPSRDWLNFVRTTRARSKIKQWFQKERRDQSLTEGRDEVMALLRRAGLGLGHNEREALLKEVAADFSRTEVDSLLISVGEGDIGANAVVQKIVRLVRPETDEEDLLAPVRPRKYQSAGPGIIVEGLDDMMVQVARCCAPVPGDPIVGFVTVGRGVSVHRSDCTNISALALERKERMVEVSWPAGRVGTFTIWIQVEALDRTNLLRDVTGVISESGGNITASSSISGRDQVALLRYEIELSDPGQLPRLIADLRGVDGVFATFRLVNEPDE